LKLHSLAGGGGYFLLGGEYGLAYLARYVPGTGPEVLTSLLPDGARDVTAVHIAGNDDIVAGINRSGRAFVSKIASPEASRDFEQRNIATALNPRQEDTSGPKLLGAHAPVFPTMRVAMKPEGTSLQVPPGRMYLYGMVTGGAAQSSGFEEGDYAHVVNAAGNLSAALAYGTSDRNAYATGTSYHDMGGVSISGDWERFDAFSGVNSRSGADNVSVPFQVHENSLVVVIGLASS
jgi:hypothetical protein